MLVSSTELTTILASVTEKPATYLAAARRLAPLREQLALVRMCTLSTFTSEMIHPYLVVEGARRGLGLDLHAAPFGQLEQQVLAPDSMLYTSTPDVIMIAARIEDVSPALDTGFLTTSPRDQVASYVQRILALARNIRERCSAHVVLWNQPALARVAAGFADASLDVSQQFAVAELNRLLAEGARTIAGTSVFDAARVAAEIGTARWFDRKLEHLARCPLGVDAQIAVARRLARHLRSTMKAPCKCLVLDLDNTLWGGVLGEDGAGGISLGSEHPGRAFKSFQAVVRSYRDRGVLLAIASKNNEADVLELFAQHGDMVLRLDDVSAKQIHWNDKATSLRAIANELNIGVEALAFFDDNPVERAWVAEQLPEVTVIDVPRDPLRYIEALDESGAFDHLLLTAEDRMRADQYRAEVARKDLEASSGSVDDFLRALQMRVEIGPIDAATLPRVAQLFGKTNQYNITTRRYSEGDLSALMSRDGTVGRWMRVTDRFGDHGLVGVALVVKEQDETYRLDSFLMSCRVLGRKAEHALLFTVMRRARALGAQRLVGEFIPTKKNAPAASFFSDTGFVADARPNWWTFDLHRPSTPPAWLEIVEHEQ